MTQGRVPRQFGSTEHLASEAIAAYVDGELRMSAYLRAAHHLSICPSARSRWTPSSRHGVPCVAAATSRCPPVSWVC